MIPDEQELIENPLALRMRNTLRFYGIDEAIIRESALKGIRNPVIGIYRIVLHQAQREYDQREQNRVCASSFGMMMTITDNSNWNTRLNYEQ